MTFPANYAVIAEDELTYVNGGSIVDALPNLMTASNWKTVTTNVVKIVGNAFMGSFVDTILGTMFGGTYAFGGVANKIGEGWKSMTNLNKFMQVLGGMASIYTLGTATVSGVQTADDGYTLEVAKV